MPELFKSIYTDSTCYSRMDGLCTAYGRVVKDGTSWQAIRNAGAGSRVITHWETRQEAEAKLELGVIIARHVNF